jgi:DNA (cytosine-5)-methyltransferase 1
VLPYFASGQIKLLAGCAPCQPFSTYSHRYRRKDGENTETVRESTDNRWELLYAFLRLAEELRPELITMENVVPLTRHKVFEDFVEKLKMLGYCVTHYVVSCSDYDVPQKRKRLVLFASLYGDVKLCAPFSETPRSVFDVIGDLPKIDAGQVCKDDSMHRSRNLSELNLKRIRASVPGGTWRDWDESLVTQCHKKTRGETYASVYGRMDWKLAPTITTEFYGYGSGRFGHPVQDRAISLREGALLQTFAESYEFTPPDETISFNKIGRMIGNAVPVNLGRAIARSLNEHLEKFCA